MLRRTGASAQAEKANDDLRIVALSFLASSFSRETTAVSDRAKAKSK
jgi:hypothetical protein